jgi:hypothetical protein
LVLSDFDAAALNRQGKSLGIRSQSIPEFDSSEDPADYRKNYRLQWKDAAQNRSERSVAA